MPGPVTGLKTRRFKYRMFQPEPPVRHFSITRLIRSHPPTPWVVSEYRSIEWVTTVGLSLEGELSARPGASFESAIEILE
jgi:hypothetical protein